MTAAKNKQLTALTSLRFFAAFFIVLLHAEGFFGIPKNLIKSTLNTQPVSFFFVLSGFIMYYCYPQFKGKHDIKKFYISRWARIWPVHVMAFLTIFFASLIYESDIVTAGSSLLESALMVITNLFLVHSWIPIQNFYTSFYSHSWSISTELFFYMLYPIVVIGWSKRWKYWLLSSAAVVVSAMILCDVFNIPSFKNNYSGLTTSAIFHVSPLIRVFEFLLGVMTGYLFSRKPERSMIFPNGSMIEVLALIILLGNMLLSIYLGRSFQDKLGTGLSSWLVHSGSCLSTAFFIYTFACSRGKLSKLLEAKFLVFLGEISFTIYMIHGHYFMIFQKKHHPLMSLPTYLQFPVYFSLIIICSYAIWKWFELPSRKSIIKWIS